MKVKQNEAIPHRDKSVRDRINTNGIGLQNRRNHRLYAVKVKKWGELSLIQPAFSLLPAGV